MIQSMTGFGKAIYSLPGKKISIEIKSLNSKQFDLNARIPSFYKEKELAIRNIIAKSLIRGKIDLNLFVEFIDGNSNHKINIPLVQNYMDELRPIAKEMDASSDLLSIIMRLPDVLKAEREEMSDDEWKAIQECLSEAINKLDEFRTSEGATTAIALNTYISNIENNLKEIATYEEERVENVRNRIFSKLEEYTNMNDESNRNRFEQEFIYYIEKLDISEEKVRLNGHCNYFKEVMSAAQSNGKKLGFISQEIGREINTIGSKANHMEIQKIVVKMKDDLEKIKEQTLNIL